jgi:ComF family protein
MSILERLTALLAPDDCLVCGREGLLLCHACAAGLPPLPGRCFGCRMEITTGVGCVDCVAQSGLFGMAAATAYQGIAKDLVGRLKFHGNQSAARSMAERMILTALLPPNALLVPLPATAAHIRERGYDQAVLVARQLSRLSGLPMASVLARSGNHHQLGADRRTRLQQLQPALRVTRPDRITGHPLILIDDVLTTGSSLTAAARVLRAAGAARIEALVFAQTPPK